MSGFDDLIRTLSTLPANLSGNLETAVKRSGVLVMGRIKAKLGKYQAGWPKLKASTVKRKFTVKSGARKGKLMRSGVKHLAEHGTWVTGTDADSPLIDMAHLKGSYTMEIRDNGMTAVVGTDKIYGPIQEFGGMAGRGHKVPIPARPHARPALQESEEEIKRQFADAIMKTFRR